MKLAFNMKVLTLQKYVKILMFARIVKSLHLLLTKLEENDVSQSKTIEDTMQKTLVSFLVKTQ